MNLPTTQTTRRRLHHTWERFQERRRQLSAAVAAKRLPRSVQAAELQYRLTQVADPHGTGSILAVQGLLNASAIEAIHDATVVLPTGSRLDLDLTGAAILSGPWIRMLEALIDALEARGVHVRVTGLSPHHPELRRH